MKWASVRRTLLSPLSRFKHSARSSCDSGRTSAHAEGGDKKRSQLRQNETDAGVGPSVIGLGETPRRGRTLFRDALCDINASDDGRGRQCTRRRSLICAHLFRRQPTQRLAELGSIGIPDRFAYEDHPIV